MSDDGVSKLACLAVPLAIFRVSNNELVDDATVSKQINTQ